MDEAHVYHHRSVHEYTFIDIRGYIHSIDYEGKFQAMIKSHHNSVKYDSLEYSFIGIDSGLSAGQKKMMYERNLIFIGSLTLEDYLYNHQANIESLEEHKNWLLLLNRIRFSDTEINIYNLEFGDKIISLALTSIHSNRIGLFTKLLAKMTPKSFKNYDVNSIEFLVRDFYKVFSNNCKFEFLEAIKWNKLHPITFQIFGHVLLNLSRTSKFNSTLLNSILRFKSFMNFFTLLKLTLYKKFHSSSYRILMSYDLFKSFQFFFENLEEYRNYLATTRSIEVSELFDYIQSQFCLTSSFKDLFSIFFIEFFKDMKRFKFSQNFEISKLILIEFKDSEMFIHFLEHVTSQNIPFSMDAKIFTLTLKNRFDIESSLNLNFIKEEIIKATSSTLYLSLFKIRSEKEMERLSLIELIGDFNQVFIFFDEIAVKAKIYKSNYHQEASVMLYLLLKTPIKFLFSHHPQETINSLHKVFIKGFMLNNPKEFDLLGSKEIILNYENYKNDLKLYQFRGISGEFNSV